MASTTCTVKHTSVAKTCSVRDARTGVQARLNTVSLSSKSTFQGKSVTLHGKSKLFQAARVGRTRHTVRAGVEDLPLGEVTEDDREYMRQAIKLALTAEGKTDPNPMVGCVIVKDDNIVGMGFHPKAGMPHAEVYALRAAGERAEGATAYVSLEPCNHFGRTPPCSKGLVAANVSRVVCGMVDPDPRVSGGGLKTLVDAGIEVACIGGAEEKACQDLNKVFIERVLAEKAAEEAAAQ
uniref:Riboflavin biosynthesis protein PYRD, chloroplastic n=1 Tax=Pyramimonas obovata TaxID=1411642 RepID=A0A6T7YPC3_9CHLO|mmetsp:Transcript_5014/g.10268  ORF Transcript_5014/g.10268 Transcript_5014/m.10268 type:complete len:237 (+) Transcript_5014:61-771(+)|eukprot:CAMPEP_0118921358 /NCGR_PEP_ID=MMETSP1169-20130426/675_1 /TAXON_ID=36882 /ORGANISM="Pyramimonas obovata, Strain CCMP722" /LENGTH=236 /DNA_ID=CAMNT_0006862071 /DNA_START=61 /DNA_END=771 /DNA_ORIENTATION=+